MRQQREKQLRKSLILVGLRIFLNKSTQRMQMTKELRCQKRIILSELKGQE